MKENDNGEIINAFEFENGNHAVLLDLGKVYDTFLALEDKYGTLLGWQFLTLKILEADPSRKYFAFPERQYRMGGFRAVMINLIEECKKEVRAKMKYLFILLTLLLSESVWSHGGGLNKDGCHNDRKTGGYHCHRGKIPTIPAIPQQRIYGSSENSINTRWCSNNGGISEYRTDGTFVDCLTDTYAVEAEFDNKWKEAIRQSLHYAESTNRRAIFLFIETKLKKDYYGELERVINKYQLPITVFVINQ